MCEDTDYNYDSDDDDDAYPYPDCPVCGGVSGFMGWFGILAWFKCILCGMEFNVPKSEIGL